MIQDDVSKLEKEILTQIDIYKTEHKKEYPELEKNYGMYHTYVRNVPSLIAEHYENICTFMYDTYYVRLTK